MKTPSRTLIVPVAAAALLVAVPAGATAAELFLPRVVGRCAMPHCSGPVSPGPAEASRVLSDAPLPPGLRLVFYEVRPEAQPPHAVAEYDVSSTAGVDLGRWYRDRMALRGWSLAEVTSSSQRWERDGAWFDIELPGPGPDRRWLRLRREPGAAAPAAERSLLLDAPLPTGAVRWRYDRADMLVEEVRVPGSWAVVADDLVKLLGSAGWAPEGASEIGSAHVTRYRRGGDALLVSMRDMGADGVEVGLGDTDCSDQRSPDGPLASVYLRDVPAPPASELAGYERDAGDGPTERWTSRCLDLDLLEAAARASWRDRDWLAPAAGRERRSGELQASVEPVAGSALVLRARAMAAGSVEIQLARGSNDRRMPDGRSLFSPDLPLPAGSDAERFRRGADDWALRETYTVPASPRDPIAWFAEAMPVSGWFFERSSIDAGGSTAVYYRGGEEILLRTMRDAAWSAELSRRRVCPSGQPAAVPPEGPRARRLAEVSVFPGATFEGFSDSVERYVVRCTSLDQLAAWYRESMERGAWTLAMTVGPEDRFARTMVFVRPTERQLPPDRRTAWAEVDIVRVWPYEYLLLHRRDPGGVRPLAGGP